MIGSHVISLTNAADGYKHIKCFGLHGTYDDALEWLKSPEVEAKPKTILWLGSSLGNFKRHEVPPFLSGFGEALQVGDTMLIGIDSCKDPKVCLLPMSKCIRANIDLLVSFSECITLTTTATV
jgi:uncharacterized SAM-dependent methyltransferase